CRSNFEAAKAEMQHARAFAGDTVSDSHLMRIGATSFGDIARFARQAESLRIHKHELQYRLRQLDGEAPEDDIDALRQGRTILSRWLRESDGPEKPPLLLSILLLLSSVLLILAALLARNTHPLFLLFALPGAAMFLVAGITLARR